MACEGMAQIVKLEIGYPSLFECRLEATLYLMIRLIRAFIVKDMG